MILLITYGLFHLNLNLTPSLYCQTYLLMLLLNSAVLSRPYNVTTGMSLTTLPPGPFLYRKGHNSRCRVLTRPLRMVKSNASFAPSTMTYARCLSRLPFLGAIGLKGFTLPHIYLTVFRRRQFRLPVRTSPSSTLLC
jgi:hypothetical protein